MSLNAATIELLIAKGLSSLDILEVAQAMEKRRDNTAAERQARHRAKQKSNAVTVTACPPLKEKIKTPRSGLSAKAENLNTPPPEKPELVSDQTWKDFLKLRRNKRAPLTATALTGIEREAAKAGWALEDALAKCVVRGWQSFEADWVKDKGNGHGIRTHGTSIRELAEAVAARQ